MVTVLDEWPWLVRNGNLPRVLGDLFWNKWHKVFWRSKFCIEYADADAIAYTMRSLYTFSMYLEWGRLWRPFPTSQAEGSGLTRPRQLPETSPNHESHRFLLSVARYVGDCLRIGRVRELITVISWQGSACWWYCLWGYTGKAAGPGSAKLKERPKDQQWRFSFMSPVASDRKCWRHWVCRPIGIT